MSRMAWVAKVGDQWQAEGVRKQCHAAFGNKGADLKSQLEGLILVLGISQLPSPVRAGNIGDF
jgi:hypothetical protein